MIPGGRRELIHTTQDRGTVMGSCERGKLNRTPYKGDEYSE